MLGLSDFSSELSVSNNLLLPLQLPPLPSFDSGSVAHNALLALTQPKGIISNVNKVATSPPPINETAMPSKIGSDKIKIEPPTKANAVIIIGRVRVSQE